MTLSLDLDIGACLSYQLWILYCFFEKWKWHQNPSDGDASPVPKSSEGRSWEDTPFSPDALGLHVSVSPAFLERNVFPGCLQAQGTKTIQGLRLCKDKRTNGMNSSIVKRESSLEVVQYGMGQRTSQDLDHLGLVSATLLNSLSCRIIVFCQLSGICEWLTVFTFPRRKVWLRAFGWLT